MDVPRRIGWYWTLVPFQRTSLTYRPGPLRVVRTWKSSGAIPVILNGPGISALTPACSPGRCVRKRGISDTRIGVASGFAGDGAVENHLAVQGLTRKSSDLESLDVLIGNVDDRGAEKDVALVLKGFDAVAAGVKIADTKRAIGAGRSICIGHVHGSALMRPARRLLRFDVEAERGQVRRFR